MFTRDEMSSRSAESQPPARMYPAARRARLSSPGAELHDPTRSGSASLRPSPEAMQISAQMEGEGLCCSVEAVVKTVGKCWAPRLSVWHLSQELMVYWGGGEMFWFVIFLCVWVFFSVLLQGCNILDGTDGGTCTGKPGR